MSGERWRVLSEWHNTWLAAPTDQRDGLRTSFATEHPELLQVADELAASSGAIDGFLETPALVLAARDLAEDEPRSRRAPRSGRTGSCPCWLGAEWETSTGQPIRGSVEMSRSRR
jgi:hypothetical protein